MSRFIDLTGMAFGRLTVMRLLAPSPSRSHWVCRCECGKETFVHGGNLRNGVSTSCGCLRTEILKRHRSRKIVPCSNCGADVDVIKSRKSGACCSAECLKAVRTMVGESNPAWKGGRQIHPQGYILVRHNGTYILEHRLVMEKHLGRELASSEVVHHKNENKTDNRIENLQLTSGSEHRLLHPVKTWSKHGHTACVECKRTESKHVTRGLCTRCYDRERFRLKGRRGRKAK
jgi:hypothetical protein